MQSLMSKPTRYENWSQHNFGYCPACGAIGFEQVPCMDSDYADFICSRYCWSNYPVTESDLMGGIGHKIIPGHRKKSYTKWQEKKPKWWLEAQREEPYSWNWRRLSQTCCLRHFLV